MSVDHTFEQLGLDSDMISVLTGLGYEAATPIQAQSIPVLLRGEDIMAQAQTGTGKTAAFALPILANLDVKSKQVQALVIAPTRELAIQVAEAFQSYAKHLKGFHVLPIYGGQDIRVQLKALKRCPHVIVGTPGRIMDHMRRGTLAFPDLKTLVLDEADEMLRMGFVEDIQWILEQVPEKHQTALFSATMPKPIQNIAKNYLHQPTKIMIKAAQSTVDTIHQSYMRVTNKQKLEALTRYLEVEDITASIIFVRTKTSSAELAEKIQARGYSAAALNGDMSQAAREKVISRLKKGALDIVIATDVAARGIDVERISHVINYDIPHDVESYIHRIGRTGRAGRSGKALLLVGPREQRLLKDIERAVHKSIEHVEPPSLQEMRARRQEQLTAEVLQVMVSHQGMEDCHEAVTEMMRSAECSAKDIAAVLVYMMQQSNPLPMHELSAPEEEEEERGRGRGHGRDRGRSRSPRSGGRTGDSGRRPSGRSSGDRTKGTSAKKTPYRGRSEKEDTEGRRFTKRHKPSDKPFSKRSAKPSGSDGPKFKRKKVSDDSSPRRSGKPDAADGPAFKKKKKKVSDKASSKRKAGKKKVLDRKRSWSSRKSRVPRVKASAVSENSGAMVAVI